jgi:hypothetical protein
MTELLWRVAGVSANIAVALPDADAGAFTALIGDCSSPEFFASVLAPLIRGHLRFTDPTDTALARFSDLAALFFACDHRSALREKWLPSPFRNACWHLVFYEEFEGLMVSKDWPHAARFTEHIGRWVSTVGGHPTTAGALVAFLDRFLGAFVPASVVAWLNTCWASTAKPLRGDFWKRNGDPVAQLRRFRTPRCAAQPHRWWTSLWPPEYRPAASCARRSKMRTSAERGDRAPGTDVAPATECAPRCPSSANRPSEPVLCPEAVAEQVREI